MVGQRISATKALSALRGRRDPSTKRPQRPPLSRKLNQILEVQDQYNQHHKIRGAKNCHFLDDIMMGQLLLSKKVLWTVRLRIEPGTVKICV